VYYLPRGQLATWLTKYVAKILNLKKKEHIKKI
jgi:hypothetical protein